LSTLIKNEQGEMEKGLIQINELTKKSKKEAISLKKDMMMAYLQCYTAQQNLFNSLVAEGIDL